MEKEREERESKRMRKERDKRERATIKREGQYDKVRGKRRGIHRRRKRNDTQNWVPLCQLHAKL